MCEPLKVVSKTINVGVRKDDDLTVESSIKYLYDTLVPSWRNFVLQEELCRPLEELCPLEGTLTSWRNFVVLEELCRPGGTLSSWRNFVLLEKPCRESVVFVAVFARAAGQGEHFSHCFCL